MSSESQSILIFSESPEVRESISSILANDYKLVESETHGQTLGVIGHIKPKVLITDFASVSHDSNAVNQIRQQNPETLVLLVCPREQRDELLETSLPNQTYRVLFSPLSPGQTRLAVSAAIKHEVSHADTQINFVSSPTKSDKPSKSRLLPILVSVGVLALAAIAGLFISNNNKQKLLDQAQAQEQQSQREDVGRLLLTAEAAKNANNLFPPAAINALELYYQALEVEPENQTIKEAIKNLSQDALGDFDLHFANGSNDEAIASIGAAREHAVYNENFAALVEQLIEQKRIAQLGNINVAFSDSKITDADNLLNTYIDIFGADAVEISDLRTKIDAEKSNLDRQEEVAKLVSNIEFSLNRNRLLTPDQQNARFYINRLENTDAAHPGLETFKQDLGNKLIDAARKAIADIDFVAGQRYIDAAQAVGFDNTIISAEQTVLTKAQDDFNAEKAAADAQAETQALALAAAEEEERLANDKLAQENAAQAEAERIAQEEQEAERLAAQQQAELETLLATPVDVALSELTPVNRTAPAYPRRYESRGTTGAATVGFTVNKDGSVSNINIVSVEPESAIAFGTAAEKAVTDWTFSPYTDADGNVRIAKSTIRIVFQ